MKSRVTKSISLLMAAILFLFMAACSSGSKNSESSGSPSASTPAETTATGSEKADQSPITFSMYSAATNANWNKMQDDVGKEITAKTGVSLDIKFSLGDDNQDIALIASSGDYPDLIAPAGGAATLVDAGAMLDLTELIDKYAPNIKRVAGENLTHMRWSKDDHSIYFIPTLETISSPEVEGVTDAVGPFMLQHAVVKELGYPKIRTLQDFENAIKTYYEKHPTIDGQKTIPLSLNADDWNIIFTVTNPAFIATGAADDGEYYVDPETKEATLHYKRPEEKEYFRWLNHMNDIGLIDPESFVQKNDQWKAKIASGRVLGMIGATWQFNDAKRSLIKEGKAERTFGIYDVSLSPDMKTRVNQVWAFSGGWGIGITKDCKDPVRAIKFLDFLASDEGQVLNNWGVEGKQYVVENGKRVIPKEVLDQKVNNANTFFKETGIGSYGYSLRYADGMKDPSGNFYTPIFPEQIVNEYTPIEKEVLAAYGKTTWRDMFPKSSEFPVKEWGAAWSLPIPVDSDANVIAEKLRKNVIWKRIPEIILAKPSEFDSKWDAFMQELDKNGAEKMEKDFTKYLKERLELWNGQ
ncbi:extracellular solute-binding protein [Cohnella sp. CFH 77786]|uniref:ABC transporter substrate-binding protein n=1 Tax=Cohnella sp. CFH 77786 TaxID=2662265 RepID=UPI001C6081D5|nr:ABC transporter substrate-binding protein [Cohnella sp. CFH 77786]MBW5445163.1 extracellular solute-binding protein [Cohnella sp. CFH 77786]